MGKWTITVKCASCRVHIATKVFKSKSEEIQAKENSLSTTLLRLSNSLRYSDEALKHNADVDIKIRYNC